MHHGWGRDRDHDSRRRRSPVESIAAGAAFAVVFGVLLFTTKVWWWAFPLAFVGVLPLIEGIRRLFGQRGQRRTDSHTRETEAEKEILRAARDNGGRLTAAAAALSSSLSIAEAKAMLEEMTKHGHAVMRVTNDGIIEFEFPEFLPRSDTGRLV